MQGTQQTLSVEDYTRYFVKKIVKDEKYRDPSELHNAGMTFYSLLQRFAREGDREDVRTPFKIMKDEFMNEWRASCRDARDELIRRLFCVLDIVHEECQNSVQNCVNGTEVSTTILEEFRLRLMKMVVGDAWKDALPLRIEALKHMHKYRNRELDGYYTQDSRKHRLKHRARHITVKKLKRTVVGPPKTSWTAVFNDLLLSSGAKLAPLLFAILDENQTMEDHLLSIEHPKQTDVCSQRGSMFSAKSGSSVSSSSVKPSSEAENSLPAADEEAPYYFKSLNSDLNAKLQQLKQQRGLTNVVTRNREAAHEAAEAMERHHNHRHIEEGSMTSKSDFSGRDLPPSAGHRSVTPFMDEPPPPWCQPDLQHQFASLQLSDGLGQTSSEDLGSHGSRGLVHSSSAAAVHRMDSTPPRQVHKSPSCHSANPFSFGSDYPSNLQYRGNQQKPLPLHEYDLSELQPFDDLDPFKVSKFDVFK